MSAALVLALDPGGTTGTAYGHIAEGKLRIAPGESRMEGWELYNILESWCRQRYLCDALEVIPRHVVWETYEYRYHSQPGSDTTPLRLIGVIELFKAWHDTEVGMWPQTAAQGMGHYSDQKLKAMGLWHKGKGHGRAATKHLLQWATFGFGGQFKITNYEMITPEEYYETYIGGAPPRRGR